MCAQPIRRTTLDASFIFWAWQARSYCMGRKRWYRSIAPIRIANRVASQQARSSHNVRDTRSSPIKLRASQEHGRRTIQCVARMLVAPRNLLVRKTVHEWEPTRAHEADRGTDVVTQHVRAESPQTASVNRTSGKGARLLAALRQQVLICLECRLRGANL